MTGTPSDGPDGEGFGAFFRRYTRTWQHALATAALTAFGTLTFVHRLFAVLAILAYVVPPVVLYLRGPSPGRAEATDEVRGDETTDRRRTRDRERETGPAGDSRADDSDGADETGEAGDGGDDRDGRAEGEHTWRAATVPSEETLLDVAVGEETAYAVGSEGAVLADDGDVDGDGWTLVVPDGPGAGSNALRGVSVVDGGGVWFAGDGGAVGRLDPGEGRHVDHSAPDGDTDDVVDVAAAAEGGAETVLLADGSGRVRRGRYREGEVTWDEPTKPGSGSSLAGVVLDGSRGYACDTSQRVYETTDGGLSFEAVGPDGVGGTLTDVAATADGCAVSDDAGVVHRREGSTWTPERLGEASLWALDLDLDGERGLACGDGGAVYERVEDAVNWERASTPAATPLRGVALGPVRALAVGDDGTVLERTVERDGSHEG